MLDQPNDVQDLKHFIEKWSNLVQDIHAAVVGTIEGKIGLITQVRELQAELLNIKEKLKNFDRYLLKEKEIEELIGTKKEISATVDNLKSKINAIEQLLEEIKPETEDTKKKKNIIYGICLAIGGLWAFIKFIIPAGIDLFKIIFKP